MLAKELKGPKAQASDQQKTLELEKKKKQNLLVRFYLRSSVDLQTGKDDRNRPSLVEDIPEKESASLPEQVK